MKISFFVVIFIGVTSSISVRAILPKSADPALANLAKTVAQQMNKNGSLEQVIKRTITDPSEQKKWLEKYSPAQLKSSPLVLVSGKMIILQAGSQKVSVTFVDPFHHEYLINGYPVTLGEKSLQKQIDYLRRVLHKTNSHFVLQHLLPWLSLLLPIAQADQATGNGAAGADSTEIDASTLGLRIVGLDSVSRSTACDQYTPGMFASLANLTGYGQGNRNAVNRTTQNVAQSFFCSKENPNQPTQFKLICSPGEVDGTGTVSEVMWAKMGPNGSPVVGEVYGNNLDADLKKVFSADFAAKIKACCADAAANRNSCSTQVNNLSPIQTAPGSRSLEQALDGAQ